MLQNENLFEEHTFVTYNRVPDYVPPIPEDEKIARFYQECSIYLNKNSKLFKEGLTLKQVDIHEFKDLPKPRDVKLSAELKQKLVYRIEMPTVEKIR